MGIVYLIQPAELVDTDRYKVGCSRETSLKRIITGYNDKTRVILVEDVDEPFAVEKTILTAFATQFTCLSGREFFAGNIDRMRAFFKAIVEKEGGGGEYERKVIGTNSDTTTQNNQETLQCSKCGRLMCRKDYLKIHEASCNGLQAKQCEICLKVFTTYQGKYQHRKNVKCSPPAPSNEMCIVISEQRTPCNAVYATNNIEKPLFLCTKCNKSLSSKQRLISHEKVCNGFDSLQCPNCMKWFTSRYGKYQHLKKQVCMKS